MNKKSIMSAPGFRPDKRLGQHFLVEPDIINKIIESARLNDSDIVLEIGPGQGALTIPLARTAGHLFAVEKDAFLTNILKKTISRAGITNVTLINYDILRWDFHEINLSSSKKIKVIGNLPYNISTPFLEKLIKNRNMVSRAILMFQLEVARRLAASPGGKEYGAMTLRIKYHTLARVLIEVSRKAFYPRPKVDSMVLELDFEKHYPLCSSCEEIFNKVVKGAFAYRRKTIFNSLKTACPFWGQKMLLDIMEKCRIDVKRRAETLCMDEFLCLTNALKLTN